MTVIEYLMNCLKKNNVTDVFGIPGGVVLDFLYGVERVEGITAHLSYHEQAAAFEACGYAQYGHQLGVAYATRGPGFTNMITGIADAYADSIPVLFITAHTGKMVGHTARFEKEQELDTISMVRNITKYAEVIEHENNAWKIEEAIRAALTGRKGPVLLDFSEGVWKKEVSVNKKIEVINRKDETREAVESIISGLKNASRPVVLAGDGVRQANAMADVVKFLGKTGVPVLSGRCSEDVGASCKNYYGYVGSHGMRCANFIFAKADYVICLGNRMAFPASSKSYLKVLANKVITRIDVDETELSRDFPNTNSFQCDLKSFLAEINKRSVTAREYSGWIEVCDELKAQLCDVDRCETVNIVEQVLKGIPGDSVIVCDVGNNEFWCSQAYVLAGKNNRVLYSKSYGALGSSVSKAIGAYYASLKPVVCFTGDQGFQLNLQELQFIAQNKLPITVCVINNNASGMIRDREMRRYDNLCVHTTPESGYGCPDLELISKAYGFRYELWQEGSVRTGLKLIEIQIKDDIELRPSLPMGNDYQDMSPKLDRKLFDKLHQL